MTARQRIGAIFNVLIFALAGVLLYLLANGRSNFGPGDQEDQRVPAEVRVETAPIVQTTLHRDLTVYGRIEPAPASPDAADARISAAPGIAVAEIHCHEGQHVDKGQILFTLDGRSTDVDLRAAQAVYAASQSAIDSLRGSTSAPVWLAAAAQWELALARAQVDRATAAQQARTVVAPISGTVVAINVRPGEMADPNRPAVELVDLSRLVAALNVPGFSASQLRVGQHVLIDSIDRPSNFGTVGSTPAATEPATAASTTTAPSDAVIVRIDPAIDPISGMASADVELPAHFAARPGQFVRGRIELETHNNCLAVPAASIVPDDAGRPQIAVVESMRFARLRRVELGITENGLVEIQGDGLQPGQTVVTTGAYALSPGGSAIALGR
jgi:RND family efflux transporter MFP subunit